MAQNKNCQDYSLRPQILNSNVIKFTVFLAKLKQNNRGNGGNVLMTGNILLPPPISADSLYNGEKLVPYAELI